MAKLVGYRRFTSKKNGQEYCVASVVSELSETEKQNGFVGQKTEDIFLPSDQVNFLNPSHIGKEIVCDYSISGGRAFLNGITIR